MEYFPCFRSFNWVYYGFKRGQWHIKTQKVNLNLTYSNSVALGWFGMVFSDETNEHKDDLFFGAQMTQGQKICYCKIPSKFCCKYCLRE